MGVGAYKGRERFITPARFTEIDTPTLVPEQWDRVKQLGSINVSVQHGRREHLRRRGIGTKKLGPG
jgi:hypothetical protein